MGKVKAINHKQLDQQLVTEFGTTRGLEREISDWMESARETLVEQLRQGFECPTKGPYLLVIEKSKQKQVDWKQLLREAYVDKKVSDGASQDDATGQAVKLIEAIEKSAKKKTILRLAVKTNPAYKNDLSRRTIQHLESVKRKAS